MILCREQFLPSENKVFALPGREEKTRWGWEMTPTSPTAEVAPRRDGETSRTRQKIKELRESGQHWQVSDLGQSWPWNSSVFLPINYGSDFQVEKKKTALMLKSTYCFLPLPLVLPHPKWASNLAAWKRHWWIRPPRLHSLLTAPECKPQSGTVNQIPGSRHSQ